MSVQIPADRFLAAIGMDHERIGGWRGIGRRNRLNRREEKSDKDDRAKSFCVHVDTSKDGPVERKNSFPRTHRLQ
jgi:hypothetical protein